MMRARWLLPVLAVALAGCAGTGNVHFQPPDAPILDGADCGAADVVAALVFGERGAQPDAGYPPDGFEPVAAVLCERGADAAGGVDIDTVRLEGDMAPVLGAFRAQSIRLPDGVMTSCAIAEYPAAGVWLLDAAGRAVRPAWPSRVCGFQQPPLAALAGLRETGREPGPVDRPAPPARCGRGAPYFQTTTGVSELSWQGPEVPARDQLRVPLEDVDALTVCLFAGGSPETRELSRVESRALLVAAAAAPAAGPCAQTSTRTASATLTRPDGSGGGSLKVELDGCQRVSLSEGGEFRAAPPALLAALAG